ncbi:DUF6226 family protein [Rhodococcus sp. 24CO]|uniref:DUF6226 family protein n=1 Tax=Rhodococcus sp. 24CO TaxID=3117460 RepID=UPI003D3413DC
MTGSVPRVAIDPAKSWWERYNEAVRSVHESGWGGNTSVLSHEICELLVDVDAAFAVTGAQTPGWPNPYEDGLDPDEAAYERASNPEKYLIVVARAQAWTKVLLDRGWAQEASPVRWALRPFDSGGADTVLQPASSGAIPLVLTTHSPVDSNHPFNVSISAGDPAVCLASIPDCACDACDSGSATLLEEIDTLVLSLVDGSLQVDVAAKNLSIRTLSVPEVARPRISMNLRTSRRHHGPRTGRHAPCRPRSRLSTPDAPSRERCPELPPVRSTVDCYASPELRVHRKSTAAQTNRIGSRVPDPKFVAATCL